MEVELTPEEKAMLKRYESSRPVSKKSKKTSKKHRFYKKPEFYAISFMILAIISGLGIALAVVAMEQVTDVDMLISMTQEEGTKELLQSQGADYGVWIDSMLWIRENLVSVILSVIGFFSVVSVMIMFVSNMYKKNKTNNNEK